MYAVIRPKKLEGEVDIISSKSFALRYFMCSALADKPTRIEFGLLSSDIRYSINCLKGLGCKVEDFDGGIIVHPLWDNMNKEALLDCGESGTALRFLIPIVSALGCGGNFTGSGRLPSRPIKSLLKELKGCEFSRDKLPLKLSGKLEAGTFTLAGNESSQYISGLLFALPLLKGDSKIILTTPLESSGYVSMTIRALNAFGIKIEEEENCFKVRGGQRYISPSEIKVEGDWSSAAFWAVADVLGADIRCKGLDRQSLQPDRNILTVLERFGAKVIWQDGKVKVEQGNLTGIDIDGSEFPDIIPVLSIVGAFARGKTRIYNASRLRLKESDRLHAISENLQQLGVSLEEYEDGLTIFGSSGEKFKGGSFSSFNDHRIAMTMAIASSVAIEPIIVRDIEAINKSYPTFFKEFKQLGGDFDVL